MSSWLRDERDDEFVPRIPKENRTPSIPLGGKREVGCRDGATWLVRNHVGKQAGEMPDRLRLRAAES